MKRRKETKERQPHAKCWIDSNAIGLIVWACSPLNCVGGNLKNIPQTRAMKNVVLNVTSIIFRAYSAFKQQKLAQSALETQTKYPVSK